MTSLNFCPLSPNYSPMSSSVRLLICTRIHSQSSTSPPPPSVSQHFVNYIKTISDSTALLSNAYFSPSPASTTVDSQSPPPTFSIHGLICHDALSSSSIKATLTLHPYTLCTSLLITPWGSFTPALNASLTYPFPPTSLPPTHILYISSELTL